MAKVYLADVSDHLLSYTQDLDLMRNNTKNMIDMIFNTISIQSSDGVKQLSLVTVVFMPLSFWTGYFGMNFENFYAIGGWDTFVLEDCCAICIWGIVAGDGYICA